MERAAWTDERLDDLAEAMRSGFARVDQDIRDMRTEMVGEFGSVRSQTSTEFSSLRSETSSEFATFRAEMREEFASVRSEMREGFGALRTELGSEFRSLRTGIFAAGGGIIVALIGVIATLIAQGA